MKRGSTGVKPYMQIDKAADCITGKIGRRLLTKSKETAAAVDQQRVNSEQDFVVQLSKVFDDHVIDMMTSEWEKSHCYIKLRRSEDEFVVMNPAHKCYSPNILSPEWPSYMVAQFARFRVVHLVEFNGSTCLLCSCRKFERYAIPCRHIYSIVGREPSADDAGVRWRKSYRHFYKKKGYEKLTRRFARCLEFEPPGIRFEAANNTLQVGEADGDKSLFNSFQPGDKQPRIRKGNRWYAVAAASEQNATIGKKNAQASAMQVDVPGLHESHELSQYANGLDAEESDNHDGDDFVLLAGDDKDFVQQTVNDDDETETGQVNGDDNVMDVHVILKPTQEELDRLANIKRRTSIYSALLPLFEQACNISSTTHLDNIHLLHQSLSNSISSMQRRASKQHVGGSNTGNIVSMASVDSTKEGRRQRQASSPRKKKRKSNT